MDIPDTIRVGACNCQLVELVRHILIFLTSLFKRKDKNTIIRQSIRFYIQIDTHNPSHIFPQCVWITFTQRLEFMFAPLGQRLVSTLVADIWMLLWVYWLKMIDHIYWCCMQVCRFIYTLALWTICLVQDFLIRIMILACILDTWINGYICR